MLKQVQHDTDIPPPSFRLPTPVIPNLNCHSELVSESHSEPVEESIYRSLHPLVGCPCGINKFSMTLFLDNLLFYYTPKYFSKNSVSRSITIFLTSLLLPPPNLETAGRILSMSVPVVRKFPSRNEFSMNVRVSSGFSFCSVIIAESSSSRFLAM